MRRIDQWWFPGCIAASERHALLPEPSFYSKRRIVPKYEKTLNAKLCCVGALTHPAEVVISKEVETNRASGK
jgi:hypothetical protein